jgi:hypothetical protein
VWGIAALLIAILLIAIMCLWERPPSDDAQHLPFILFADAGVKPDDAGESTKEAVKTIACGNAG